MGIRKQFCLGALAAAVLLVVSGCASQKEPAEQALAGIEKTLTGSGAQVQKYLGGAIVAGVAAVVAGEKSGQGIPKSVVTDGPVVTKANAPGMQWMQSHYLI